jgi:predicted DsbA family dithiol-disulfide isomerase
MNRQSLRIDVVSDVVCPWCYLGKRRLEHAVALVPEVAVSVHWRPYQLDPSVPPEGMSREDYIVGKFGNLAALNEAHQRLTDYGRAEGVDYHFERITRSANTINAHRVVRWASAEGRQEPMVERLFAAYFGEGRDIGEIAVLADIAGEVGLDRTIIAARLGGDDDRAAVAAEIADAYRIGVTGVPTFILAERYGVVGAQSAETLAGAIRQAAAKQAELA